MWPTSLWNLAAVVAVLCLLLTAGWIECVTDKIRMLEKVLYLNDDMPQCLRNLLVSLVAGLLFFTMLLFVRRYTLRALLSYRDWMYQAPRSQSRIVFLWGLIVRLVSGYKPSTYSYQQSLPRLPVPPLKQTLKLLIQSLMPLYGKDLEKIHKLKCQAKEFEKTVGPKLQNILHLKSWWSENWVTDWWEKYIYLMGRSSLSVNSNYYIHDQSYHYPTRNQVSRAANIAHMFMSYKRLIDHEEMPVLLIRSTIPLCMSQYERQFSTTSVLLFRIPRKDIDEIVHYDTSLSKHIVVVRKGMFYKLCMFDSRGYLLSQNTLEKQLEWILQNAEECIASGDLSGDSLPALTGLERGEWSDVRTKHMSDGVNSESLNTLESAVFILHLEAVGFKSNDFSGRCKYLLHGNGRNIWFDKSVNVLVFPDGRFGMNCEHTVGDAPIMAHVIEYCLTQEGLEDLYDNEGRCIKKSKQQNTFRKPMKLLWDIDRELKLKINKAIKFNVQVSPDAFIQMALQLTYFKMAGKFALTYEASMTRLYRGGRTETVRSLTSQSTAFVRSMTTNNHRMEERRILLQIACEQHQQLYRDAMNGKGIDRHLFGLYVVSKGLNQECEFLKSILMLPWTLSTSQQPQQQMVDSPPCDLPKNRPMASPGGGFGPVSDDGYGVSYMITGEFALWFHVSSKVSHEGTGSAQFMESLFESLSQMKSIFS